METVLTVSLISHGSMIAIVGKYLADALFSGVAFGSVLESFMQMIVVGIFPDFLVTTVPLALNCARLTATFV